MSLYPLGQATLTDLYPLGLEIESEIEIVCEIVTANPRVGGGGGVCAPHLQPP